MTGCRIIAIFNHKGGVGKTTTAVNLAAGIAHAHGKRVLVVDMDPQANATRALIGKELAPEQLTVRHVLLQELSPRVTVAEIIVNTRISGLGVAPADLSLSEAEMKLVPKLSRDFALKALEGKTASFEYIIVDCPPSLGLLSLNALAAAEGVIIPCETQYLSLRGLHYVRDVIGLVQEKLNPRLRILGVLATKFYVLSSANNEALRGVRSLPGIHVFESVISRDVRAEEAPNHAPLVLYAPEARATQQYLRFADEVIRICQG
jgi:chromosome partitioning protein